MYESILPQLETPSILIDAAKVKENVRQMQGVCDRTSVNLRPHIKTHKMIPFAKMQLDAGAAGITCAKVSEAEVMAEGGCMDIFIAYPLVGDFRIKRAAALAKKVTRLILAVDSKEGAEALNQAAGENDMILEVRLELETGARRTGIRDLALLETAKAIAGMEYLNLTGIYTFKSLSLENGDATTSNAEAAIEEGRLLGEAADALNKAGIMIQEISGGSSPTGTWVAETGKVTEIRPGTYLFKDCILWKEGVAELDEIAALVAVTVVSTPCDEYAVIDGGTKVFPTDIELDKAPYYYEGYAKVLGTKDLVLTRLNEEHGMLYSKNGHTGLTVGQKLLLYPGHVCTTINLRNWVYVLEDGEIRKIPVDARGMSV